MSYLGQIEGHVQIVIDKVGVLLGVQHLEQRGRGVSVIANAEFVDLCEVQSKLSKK